LRKTQVLTCKKATTPGVGKIVCAIQLLPVWMIRDIWIEPY